MKALQKPTRLYFVFPNLEKHGHPLMNSARRLSSSCVEFEEACIDRVRLSVITKKKDNELNLPPTKDSLKLHTKRAAYQTAIWRHCHQSDIKPPLPEKHGWKLTEGLGLEPEWSLKPNMPPAVIEFVQRRCKLGQCVDNHCSCQKKDRFCTDICLCTNYSNIPMMVTNPDFNDDSDLSESDSDSDID